MSQKPPANNLDAYAPQQIANMVEQVGVVKARLPLLKTIMLGLLAGAFISFGAMFYTLVMSGNELGFGLSRLVGGIAFSLGLVLVVIAGAELFTGNNLIVMAWADRKINSSELLRNWILVYFANFAGAIGMALLVHWSGVLNNGGGVILNTAISIAVHKVQLNFVEAFIRGLLGNALVCLAVWLCIAAHDVASKVVAIVFPVSAFIALGFEHSVANMYLIPIAMLSGADQITVTQFLIQLGVVTLGNVVGGCVFVALVYWIIYLRDKPS